MAGVQKPLEAVAEQDLQELLTEGVPEGRHIEYKRQLPGNSDDEKREFLSDVSSFANAAGGDLLYGIEEAGGVPTRLVGVNSADPDAEILRLENIVRTGVEPRIPGIHLRAVPLANGNNVFVIRVPQSWAPPHMVVFKNLSRFFSRTSAGKYQLDVAELRAQFLGSANAVERIRRFRDERLARIVAGEGAFDMSGPALIVLHLVPLRLADSGTPFDVRLSGRQTLSLAPLYSNGWDKRYNVDGFATFSRSGPRIGSYVQVFRHGAIEAVEARLLDPGQANQRTIPAMLLATELVESVLKYLAAQRELSVQLPIVVMLGLVGIKGYQVAAGQRWFLSGVAVDRDIVTCPEVIVEDWDADVTQVLRPCLDAIWNAGGFAECDLYDKTGNWQPK
ncbi:MAG TPA: ATP-binding protein [Longimicrobium sp.]|jgi:hypothetical protein